LVEEFSTDKSIPAFFRGVAHFILGETYQENLIPRPYFTLDRVTKKSYQVSECSWINKTFRHYLKALEILFNCCYQTSFADECLVKPTSVAVTHLVSFIIHPKIKPEIVKLYDAALIHLALKGFVSAVSDRYLPALAVTIKWRRNGCF